MPGDRIGVIALRPGDRSLQEKTFGPAGLHLRWSFPPPMGFPAGGFNVYRRLGNTKKHLQTVSFEGMPQDRPLPPRQRIGSVVFVVEPDTTRLVPQGSNALVVTTTGPAVLELRFDDPVVRVRVGLTGVNGSSTLRAYSDRRLIGEVADGGQVRQLSAPAITHIRLELGFSRLDAVTFSTEDAECNDSDWKLVKPLPVPTDPQQGLIQLEPDIRNHYVTSSAEAREKYAASAEELMAWVKRLLAPDAESFENPNLPPHLLRRRSPEAGGTSSAVYPQSIVLLAALDPNIARLVSLYWVDPFTSAHGAHPQTSLSYDYKVEGLWSDGAKRCGLALDVGLVQGGLPSVPPELEGEQVPGLRWVDRSPRGRVVLRWNRWPPALTADVRAVEPVLYDLRRTFEGKTFPSERPVLVPGSVGTNVGRASFVDTGLGMGVHTYELRAIDVFGQLGPPRSVSVDVKEIEAPPPPVRLRTLLAQGGAGDSELHVQFEYGARQDQQAPDADHFGIYWRPDTLVASGRVNVEVHARTGTAGRFVYTVTLAPHEETQTLPAALETLVGDVLTNVSSGADPPLPAGERRRYRIGGVQGSDRLVLEPTADVLEDGTYELVRSPHDRSSWQPVPVTVPWRPPLAGVVRAVGTTLSVRVEAVTRIGPRPDPFGSVPPAQRRSFPVLPLVPEIVEVQIDRDLLEPDVFAGATAEQSGGHQVDVLYAVSGGGAGGRARLGLPADTVVAVGDTLALILRTSLRDRLCVLRVDGRVDSDRLSTPGGDVALNQDQVMRVARVISSAANGAGVFELLVRVASADALQAIEIDRTRARYYAPYRITLPVSLDEVANAPIALPIAPGQGSRDGFIAVNAIDARGNAGPLTPAVQFTVVRPPLNQAPARPYPCNGGPTAPAGYATPPDRLGRATICVAWDVAATDEAAGVRYEVARALDVGILAAHLKNWQLGRPGAVVEPPLVAGPHVTGTVTESSFDSTRGVHRVRFDPTTPVADPTIFRGGRLGQSGRFVQVTLAKLADGGLAILVQTAAPDGPTIGSASLEAPPTSAAARADVSALQRLAVQNPEAFGLATGVPIAPPTFTDEVPGIGRNRFFYCVRAVDLAGNRSPWSAVSVPFHQVDTTPPETPRDFQVLPGHRSAILTWSPPADPLITAYRVFRRLGDGPDQGQGGDASHVEVRLTDMRPRPLSAVAGTLSLPRPVDLLLSAGVGVGDIEAGIVVRPLTASDDAPNLFVPGVSRAIVRTRLAPSGAALVSVIALHGLTSVPPETALQVTVGQQALDGDPGVLAWTDADLAAGALHTYRVAAVKTVPTGTQSSSAITVVGPPTAAVTVVPVDRSIPSAPSIAEVTRADARVRVTLQAAGTTAAVLVERRAAGDPAWRNAPVEGGAGWRPWPAGAGTLVLHDDAARPATAWSYRARLRTIDGRTSEPSAAGAVPAEP